MSRLVASADVGGTFIDVVVADFRNGATRIAKVLHRKGNQGPDIIRAITALVTEMGHGIDAVETLVVGTTVVTNALLEAKLARTALVTTKGFRDVMEIARMHRPSSYDLHKRRSRVVIERELRHEIDERLDHHGNVLTVLDPAQLQDLVVEIKAQQVDAVAVSLLYSFLDPAHEHAIADALSELGVPVSLSSDVLPVFREYERTVATALNAATNPVMGDFLEGLARIEAQGAARTFVMSSAGGSMTFSEARRFPIKCAMSGPAGGAVGAQAFARFHGLQSLLTLDVGGTSTDIAMLREGRIPSTNERVIGGYPVAVPSAEIETIGAGGGSLASVDRAGRLMVGPESAGSMPGPVGYSLGGSQPTVTDAHLALHRLGERSMLKGEFVLDRAAAIAAIETEIAKPLNVTWQRAAHGILELANANMARAVRMMSIERGIDPRTSRLLAFGGAGALHAVDVARQLKIPRVMVPFYCGVFSAFGILSVEASYDTQRTWRRPLGSVTMADIRSVTEEMKAQLEARACEDHSSTPELRHLWMLEMRYIGQSYAIAVELAVFSAEGLEASRQEFLREHMARYGHASPTDAVEIINLRLTTTVCGEHIRDHQPPAGPTVAPCAQATREVWFSPEAPMTSRVFSRNDLPDGWTQSGPLIIEQLDSVTVIGPGDVVEVIPRTRALAITLDK
ncbi:hydantoinase/oxoprolinase family protein [Mesorhizobium sp. B2-7-1]|uniref:hydantoinase/oxoprolinase family protein n=1 Tax=Mesorhizobium sp. B2-7-1 TaxID=2589909 RepID=UPI00112732A0|nr:hydantoinase/oxoprolinase family protein [Mesorhizobium sp. B2-7-1]TPJ71266.1 hydantoinase/oxoprolinase family protein [Mesorhizobium sp. B2-7-1]